MIAMSLPRSRRHGPVLGPPARRELERRGWRTTVDYVENHERSLDGRLLGVRSQWVAVAEHHAAPLHPITARGGDLGAAWDQLLDRAMIHAAHAQQTVAPIHTGP